MSTAAIEEDAIEQFFGHWKFVSAENLDAWLEESEIQNLTIQYQIQIEGVNSKTADADTFEALASGKFLRKSLLQFEMTGNTEGIEVFLGVMQLESTVNLEEISKARVAK